MIDLLDLDTFRSDARAWLAAHNYEAPRDYGAILPHDLVDQGIAWQRLLFAEGWAGIHWPVEHGGRGLTPDHNATWIEECARAGVPAFINMVGIVLAGTVIQKFGTDEQKAAHLRATLAADQLWCQLFSEPGAGSDLGSLSTRAERDGERWMVNGQKVWTSGGRYSGWGILMARTDPDAPKHKGISFFLMDMSLPGIEVRPLRQMTGEAEFDEVFFTDVAMPVDALDRPRERRLDGWHGDAHERARPHRRVDHRARATARADRRTRARGGRRRRPRCCRARPPRGIAVRGQRLPRARTAPRPRSRAPRDRS